AFLNRCNFSEQKSRRPNIFLGWLGVKFQGLHSRNAMWVATFRRSKRTRSVSEKTGRQLHIASREKSSSLRILQSRTAYLCVLCWSSLHELSIGQRNSKTPWQRSDMGPLSLKPTCQVAPSPVCVSRV